MTKIIGRPVCGSTTIVVERIVSDGQPRQPERQHDARRVDVTEPSAVPRRAPAVGEEV